MVSIRTATLADAPKLLDIYDYYVRNTAISFEYDTPTLSEFEGRMKKTLDRFPYLVAEEDGKIWGYTYAATFIPRAAYSHCCETTIYLRP